MRHGPPEKRQALGGRAGASPLPWLPLPRRQREGGTIALLPPPAQRGDVPRCPAPDGSSGGLRLATGRCRSSPVGGARASRARRSRDASPPPGAASAGRERGPGDASHSPRAGAAGRRGRAASWPSRATCGGVWQRRRPARLRQGVCATAGARQPRGPISEPHARGSRRPAGLGVALRRAAGGSSEAAAWPASLARRRRSCPGLPMGASAEGPPGSTSPSGRQERLGAGRQPRAIRPPGSPESSSPRASRLACGDPERRCQRSKARDDQAEVGTLCGTFGGGRARIAAPGARVSRRGAGGAGRVQIQCPYRAGPLAAPCLRRPRQLLLETGRARAPSRGRQPSTGCLHRSGTPAGARRGYAARLHSPLPSVPGGGGGW